ncbi:MAG: hypothetical protein RIB59_09775 [Rhodospirillales bacterium]
MSLCHQTPTKPSSEEENNYALVGNRLMIFCSRNRAPFTNAANGSPQAAATNETDRDGAGSEPGSMWSDWLKNALHPHP